MAKKKKKKKNTGVIKNTGQSESENKDGWLTGWPGHIINNTGVTKQNRNNAKKNERLTAGCWSVPPGPKLGT